MQINFPGSFKGPQRAHHLKLQSSRFKEPQMSQHAQEAIEYVKRKDRSYLELPQWKQKRYYKSDATAQLRNCPDQIPRVDSETLTVQQFVEKYEKKGLPVIIKGCAKNWNLEKWTFDSLYKNFKDSRFKVGQDDEGYKLKVHFKYYMEYLLHNRDDSPLYLFESSIEDHKEAKTMMQNYSVPPYFCDDLFKLAGQSKRPPYRWVIIGPQRSGTTVHIDPLQTSAWNTSLQGHKRWITFGKHVPKTVVKGKQFRSKNYEDEAINYFVEILPKLREKYSREELQMQEFIQGPGQTVFIPGGVWHAVLNLDDTIAVTQNVMTHNNFQVVWKATRSERPKFAIKFLQNLKEKESKLYEKALQLNKQDSFTMGQRYCKQSVSLSFSSSSRSSSSSSSSSSASFSSEGDRRKNKNKVDVPQRKFSCSRSRSRDRQTHRTRSEEKRKKSNQ